MPTLDTFFTDFAARVNHVGFSDASFHGLYGEPELHRVRRELFGSLLYRPAIFRRGDVRWIAVNAWRAGAKHRGLDALKRAKQILDPDLVSEAAETIAALVRQLVGSVPADAVTCVPCGHSRRADCFSKRLGVAVAVALGIPFIQAFEDRPCHGSSHPRTSTRLAPLEQIGRVPGSVILVDDLSTSGRHLEESILALRGLGATASAFAWISGGARVGRPFGSADGPRWPGGSGGLRRGSSTETGARTRIR